MDYSTFLSSFITPIRDFFVYINMSISDFIALSMAFITIRLLKETIKMRKVQTEPEIQISLDVYELSINSVRLKIENIGLGAARNITFIPTVYSGGEISEELLKEFTKSNFFKVGIRNLGSLKMIYSNYTNMSVNFNDKKETILSFKVTYESRSKEKYIEEILIDMSELVGLQQIGSPYLARIAKSLETIDTNINKILSNKISVNSYTQEDRDNIQKEEEKWISKQEETHKEMNLKYPEKTE